MPFDQLARDIRYAARGLWRDRPFTLTTVSTLTVAIALVTVVFTIFNAYVLRPYAVRDPYSLYEVRWHTRPAGGSGTRWTQAGRTFRWSDYQELQVVVIGVADDIANEMVYQGRHVPHLYMPTTRAASQARSLLVRGRSAADVRDAVQLVLSSSFPPLSSLLRS